ncbi:sce7726 family protein [Psychrobacillus soli]|uniref:Sce7726 family protein n=1 Tax=Psychrobacillus soli TaxID=1543965 RepID=A0A544TJN6_9BACI|nr:sce7726 family protein [Psychrobacillus soli]TQR17646.1 sce7726 family protein [Psychrobacillus soli]
MKFIQNLSKIKIGDSMGLLNDTQVRELLLEELNQKYSNCDNTRIINELGLDFGAARIDVAVVNGIIHGYEIKSDLDTLYRLPRQLEYYNRAFERMTIVVSRKYLEEVKVMVPKWWGIKTISADQTRLINVRKGKKVSQQDPELIMRLLWKKELEKFIDYLSLNKSLKKMRKNQLLEYLGQEVDFKITRQFVYTTLKKRENWRLS